MVRRMVFEMGESRPKEAPQWRDPFAAYRAPKGDKPPMPVRPVEGRATWREFAALFIDTGAGGPHGRPLVLNQIDHLVLGGDLDVNGERVFRCIGVRTDMKAKVFEWMEAALDIPLRLLDDPDAQNTVLAAVGYAEVIADAVRSAFGRFGSRYRRLRMRMLDLYWMDLAGPFREAVLAMSQPDHAALALEDWHRAVRSRARQRLREAADLVGDTGDQLRVRALVLADFDRRAAQAQAQFPTR